MKATTSTPRGPATPIDCVSTWETSLFQSHSYMRQQSNAWAAARAVAAARQSPAGIVPSGCVGGCAGGVGVIGGIGRGVSDCSTASARRSSVAALSEMVIVTGIIASV